MPYHVLTGLYLRKLHRKTQNNSRFWDRNILCHMNSSWSVESWQTGNFRGLWVKIVYRFCYNYILITKCKAICQSTSCPYRTRSRPFLTMVSWTTHMPFWWMTILVSVLWLRSRDPARTPIILTKAAQAWNHFPFRTSKMVVSKTLRKVCHRTISEKLGPQELSSRAESETILTHTQSIWPRKSLKRTLILPERRERPRRSEKPEDEYFYFDDISIFGAYFPTYLT